MDLATGSPERIDLTAIFAALVAERPGEPLVFGPERIHTREDIDRGATGYAGQLHDAGLAPDGLVAFAAANGAEFLSGLLGIWRAGGVPVLIDRDVPEDRQVGIARALGAALHVQSGADARDGFALRPVGTARPRVLRDAAVVKLTSGSTGRPRGIVMSAAALGADSRAVEDAMGIGGRDRVLAAVPMSYSYGFGNLALPALLAGRQIVVPPPGRPLAVLAAARDAAATVLPTVPVFLEAMTTRDRSWRLPGSIRLVVSAGAPLRPEVARAFRERFGQPVHVFYGASECGGITYDRTGSAAERGTVGVPLPGVAVELCPKSRVVLVRSPAVASGYLPVHRSALRGGCYRTGDLGTFDGGELRLVGRRGACLDLGGHKLDPRELEAVIRTMPGVDDVHVAVMPRGEGRSVSCALVETRSTDLDRNRVLAFCRAHLPRYQLPRRVLIVPEIPRNGRGKVEADTVRRLTLEIAGRFAV